MLNFSDNIRIYAYTRPTDMRKGFNGLSGIVREDFQADPTDGSLFVFVNRRRDRMKLLHFTGPCFNVGSFHQIKFPQKATPGIN